MTHREPEALGDLVRRLLATLGVGDLTTWQRLRDEWSTIVDEPWRSHATPVSLADRTLIVRASTPAAVSLLRYGTAGLMASIEVALGENTVTRVEVRKPERNAGREHR